jgi:hypothetical protein
MSESLDYETLDPGIRDVVRRLRDRGFETTDSGDGVSKPAEWYAAGEAIPFPHVVIPMTGAMMKPIPYPGGGLAWYAEHVAEILGDGWTVEGVYVTATKSAHLFARHDVSAC